MPTTIVLRHRDTFFDAVTKRRYHEAFEKLVGIVMPTAAEEASDPSAADAAYIATARKLRELTRRDKDLLLRENIAYGFHRNMLGMKPVGILTSICALLWSLFLAGVLNLDPFRVNLAAVRDIGLPALLTFLVSIAMLTAWIVYFNKSAVRRIGFTYAERLFETGVRLRPRKQR
jgi:hypothetical protein